MKYIFAFFLILKISICRSQKFNYLNDSICELKSKEMCDTKSEIISIKRFFFDEYKIVDESSTENGKTVKYKEFKKYIFTKEYGKLYVVKLDNFGESEKIEISRSKVFEFAQKNINIIKKEKLKDYLVVEKQKKGKKIYNKLIVPFKIYNEVFIKNHLGKYKLVYDTFCLTTERNENINFDRNNNLKIIKFYKICEIEVAKLEKNKKFVLK